jgi:glycosyltransferase involved in cell wall biosynthesis
LRLAVVSPFVDRCHGTERALAELLERLARDHHCEIHLYAQRVDDLAPTQRFTGSRTDRFADSSAIERGAIIWHKVPSISGPHLLQFLFWLFLNASQRTWDRKVRGLQFDLVLSPGINCFDADVVIVHALFHRLRELVREERGTMQPGLYRRFHRRVYYSLLTWLERRIYSSSKASLAAVSRRTAALLNDYFHRPDVRVIPNGVDAAQFSPARRLALRAEARSRRKFLDNDFVLVLMGNDWHTKGLSTILAALARSPDVPLRLLVAGQDAAASSFREAARSLGLSEKCRWETASVDAIDLYAAADVYVSPSREDSFGLPVLEAMACGLPVITSVLAGVSEIITGNVDGFVLSDPNDAPTLMRHLKDLQGQPDLRLCIGENAARTAQAHTWDRHAAAVWQFLQEAKARK